jgi:hypothetical protein
MTLLKAVHGRAAWTIAKVIWTLQHRSYSPNALLCRPRAAKAEEGVRFRDIAGVIGRRLNVPVVAKTAEEAANHFGWFAHFAAINNLASSQRTREQLGWHAKQPGLLADLDRESYFAG